MERIPRIEHVVFEKKAKVRRRSAARQYAVWFAQQLKLKML